MELPLRRLEPLAGVAFEDDSETALGVLVELLQWLQALCESTEQHLLDATHFLHRFAEVTRSLSCCCCVVAGLEFREAATNLHLKFRSFLIEEIGRASCRERVCQ